MTSPTPRPRRRRARAAAFAALLLVLPLSPVEAPRASQARDLSLQEMVRAAGTILSGRVEEVVEARIGSLPVHRVTFALEEAVRVEPGRRSADGRTVTLTFLGGQTGSGFPLRVSGMPRFRPGERLVLLAYPSSDLGLTAPVGLSQGRLAVSQGPAGLALATAGAPSRRLLEGLEDAPGLAGPAATATPAGAPGGAPAAARRQDGMVTSLPYAELMETLRRLAAETGP